MKKDSKCFLIANCDQKKEINTSINRIDSKTFSINIIEDNLIKNALLTEVNKII